VEGSEFESRYGKNIVSSANPPGLFWGPPILSFNGYRGPLKEVERPRSEVNLSAPCSAEIKNNWSQTSTPPIYDGKMDEIGFYV